MGQRPCAYGVSRAVWVGVAGDYGGGDAVVAHLWRCELAVERFVGVIGFASEFVYCVGIDRDCADGAWQSTPTASVVADWCEFNGRGGSEIIFRGIGQQRQRGADSVVYCGGIVVAIGGLVCACATEAY